MAAHLPHLPFLLFVFLAVQAPTCHGDPASLLTNYEDSMCSESVMCGSVNITYPFYLSNRIRETSDYSGYYSCGYTDLNISCQGEGPSARPVIRLGGESYTVQNISYDADTRTVILADNDALAGGNCPAVRHDVTFDDVWLHNTSSTRDLAFYFGCYSSGGPVPPELSKYQINCDGFQSWVPGGGVVFVLAPEAHEIAQEYALASKCKEVVSVLVNTDVLTDTARNWTNFTRGGYGYVLKQGFELEWSRAATDQCPQCEQSGGKCSYSQNKTFLGCLCSNSKAGYPDCRPRHGNKKTITEIVATTSCLLLLCLLILAFFLTRKYSLLPFKSKSEPRIESFLQKNRNLHPKRYSYAEVKRMTKSFAVKLGQGGFGAVYKGNITNGCQIAV